MRTHSWNKAASFSIALAWVLCCTATAQTPVVSATVPLPPSPSAIANLGADALLDALACRIAYARYPGLMRDIRAERQEDFRQAYRQYSDPMLDVYALREPVQAWGTESDTIVIASNRVMMAVKGSLDAVTAHLEQMLAESSQSPLSGALDEQHALVIFQAVQPGLEGMVLIGCEYRIADISLLEDPQDAWRKPPAAQPLPTTP